MILPMADNQNQTSKKEWVTHAMGKVGPASDDSITEEMLNEEAVMLLYGKNMFGDPVYSYLKFTLRNFRKMREAMIEGQDFKPSDFGEVIAAGRGDPPQELRDEMRIQYGLIDTPRPEQGNEPEGLNTPKFFEEDDGF